MTMTFSEKIIFFQNQQRLFFSLVRDEFCAILEDGNYHPTIRGFSEGRGSLSGNVWTLVRELEKNGSRLVVGPRRGVIQDVFNSKSNRELYGLFPDIPRSTCYRIRKTGNISTVRYLSVCFNLEMPLKFHFLLTDKYWEV